MADHAADEQIDLSPEDAEDDAREDGAAIERGRLLFAGDCTFVKGVAALNQLPDGDLPEVAFVGRSNVGKSSLINALTGRKSLARTSNTPGRTQQLNFFNLGDRLMLVDLPGYGYAKASAKTVKAWTALLTAYLRGRPNLARVILLIDARHGVKPNDHEMMTMLDKAAVVFLTVATKTDKLTPAKREFVLADLEKALEAHPAAYPAILATSAVKGTAIPELRAEIAALAEQ